MAVYPEIGYDYDSFYHVQDNLLGNKATSISDHWVQSNSLSSSATSCVGSIKGLEGYSSSQLSEFSSSYGTPATKRESYASENRDTSSPKIEYSSNAAIAVSLPTASRFDTEILGMLSSECALLRRQ